MSEDFCCFVGMYLKKSLFSEEFETAFGNEKLCHNKEVIIWERGANLIFKMKRW